MLSSVVATRRLYEVSHSNGWKKSVEWQEGYSKTEKGTMVLSQPTRQGLKMACK